MCLDVSNGRCHDGAGHDSEPECAGRENHVWCGADASKRALPGGSAPAGDVCERAQLAKLAKLALALAQGPGQGQGQDGELPTVACMDKRRV